MIRLLVPAGLLASSLLAMGSQIPTKGGVLDVSHKRFADADIAEIAAPETIEVLGLRGQMGYGSDSVTDAGIALLPRLKNLRVLKAGGLGLTDRSLEAISRLEKLEELGLDSNQIAGAELGRLAKLKKLRRLNLDFNKLDRKALEALRKLPNLTYLSLRDCFVVDDDFLETCSGLPKLEQLNFPENASNVTDRGLECLSRLRALRNVDLRRASKVTDAGLAHLATMTALEELTLSDLRSVTPRGIDSLAKLVNLRKLHIDAVALDDASVRSLGALTKVEDALIWNVAFDPDHPLDLEPLGGLRSLRYLRTNQTVSSKAIRALATLENLESISDELTVVTDEDLTHLARLPKLRTLMLAGPNVTAQALPTLARMKSLRLLYVSRDIAITPQQWTELGRSSLPDCRIALARPPYTVYRKGKESD